MKKTRQIIRKNGKFVFADSLNKENIIENILPFTGKTDEEWFGGQSFYESHKEQTDIDCLIEAHEDKNI